MASKRKSNRGGILGGTDKQVEQLLRQYLDEHGWSYKWEPTIGSKRPDALVVDAEGHPRAVIEATWLPLYSLQERLRAKQEQAQAAAGEGLPFLLYQLGFQRVQGD